MPTLTLLPAGRVIEAEAGRNLLQLLLEAGEKIVVKCGGNASCGACHVFVRDGRKHVNRITPAENAKLDTLVGVASASRLACQVVLGTEPLTVEMPGALSG